MLYIGRWTKITVVIIGILGVIFTVPNFLPSAWLEKFPSWVPHQTISLGLDLQGGSYLLMEVDLGAVSKERLETLQGDVRAALRKAHIGYTDLNTQGDTVTFRVIDPARLDEARNLVKALAAPAGSLFSLGNQEYDIAVQPDGRISMTMSQAYQNQSRGDIVGQSIEVVRRRIDELGTREPAIQRQGEDRILIQVPGLKDPGHLKEVLGKTAKMTFRLVDMGASAADAVKGVVPLGDELLYEEDKNGNKTPYVIERRVMVSGDRLTDARAGFDQRTGEPVINFRFDSSGAKKFGDVTKENVGRPFAIVLDNKVLSAPVIREPILGGAGQISGSFTVQSATDLSSLLRAGALPAPLKVIEERTVGAELGADSIAAGKLAAIGGLLAVVVFMFLTYGLFGGFANLALAVNITLLMAILTAFQATLTLPGIAGMVFTMGMAVDANVLIYERIREEMRSGKTIIAAIDAGFRRATATIIDTNATHVLAALILYFVGTGPVRGFAVTLGLGVATSFFSAVMVTRLIVVTWLRQMRPKALTI